MFETAYEAVKGIVTKAAREYYVALWAIEDWHQEGMLALFQLLEKEPDIEGDTTKLRCYFKAAFTNHIKDIIRRQESQKHRFNRMVYEEITETAYRVPSKTLVQDDLVAFYGALESYESQLTSKEKGAPIAGFYLGIVLKARRNWRRSWLVT